MRKRGEAYRDGAIVNWRLIMAEMETAGTEQSQVETVSESRPAAPVEKMVPQSKVDEIVTNAKRASYDRGKQESMQEYTKSQQPKSSDYSFGGIQQMSEDKLKTLMEDIAKKAAKENIHQLQQQMMEEAAHKQNQTIINKFVDKMSEGSQRYPDFDKTVASLDLKSIPDIILLATEVDNTADVMHELANNPYKIGNILALKDTPHLARLAMNKLSESIKQNQQGKQEPYVREPLSQIKSTNIGPNNGDLSVSDLRKAPWLRA